MHAVHHFKVLTKLITKKSQIASDRKLENVVKLRGKITDYNNQRF